MLPPQFVVVINVNCCDLRKKIFRDLGHGCFENGKLPGFPPFARGPLFGLTRAKGEATGGIPFLFRRAVGANGEPWEL